MIPVLWFYVCIPKACDKEGVECPLRRKMVKSINMNHVCGVLNMVISSFNTKPVRDVVAKAETIDHSIDKTNIVMMPVSVFVLVKDMKPYVGIDLKTALSDLRSGYHRQHESYNCKDKHRKFLHLHPPKLIIGIFYRVTPFMSIFFCKE